MVLLVGPITSYAAQNASDCVSVNVVVLGQTVQACVPTSSLPKVTVTVPAPRITVQGPTVTLPGPVRTVTRNVQVPGPEVTKTQTVSGPRVTGPTVTQKSTVSSTGQTSTSRVTVTSPSSAKTVPGETVVKQTPPSYITITKAQAIGISILTLVFGALLAIALLAFAYRYGWIKGDGGNRKFLSEISDTLRRDRRH